MKQLRQFPWVFGKQKKAFSEKIRAGFFVYSMVKGTDSRLKRKQQKDRKQFFICKASSEYHVGDMVS